MPILGAILAGGQSRRFGSDKALARIGGASIFDHMLSAITPQVDAVVVCGRDWPGLTSLPDYPGPGFGPLAGLCAALVYAREQGFDHVLSVPVDTWPLPSDLVERLDGGAPSVLRTQHLIGIWPSALAAALRRHIDDGNRSIRSWIAACGPRMIDDSELGLRNINFRRDLDAL